MALDLARLRNHVTHSLQGASVPSQLVQDDLINDAGRLLYNSHPWNFRNRPPVSLDFVASQAFVELPGDFGEMVAYRMVNDFGITFTTPQDVATHRSTTVTVSQNYYWATIVFPSQLSPDVPPPAPRIEVWPTPASASADALTIWYRNRWPVMGAADNTEEFANVPEYAEMALLEMVRAVTAGWAERLLEPGGGVGGYVQRVLEGPIWGAARTSDSLVQSDYGSIHGGAIECLYPHTGWRSRTASAVSDPA